MMRPTRRTVLIFTLGFPLALFLLIYDQALWPFSFNYGALVLIALLSDGALALGNRALAVTVRTPARLYIGEQSFVTTVLSAPRSRRATHLELLLEQRGELDPPVLTPVTLETGRELSVHLPLMPRRRGKIVLDQLWLRWVGPLGLIERTRIVPIARSIDVLPNVRGVESGALQFFAQEAIYGVKIQQQRGEGAEFDSLREYAPGFDMRFIDWKHSARHRKLLSKEFKTERNHQVVLAFDTGYLMREPVDGLPRLDHAINAGLLLGWISLQGGDLVATFGFDASVRQYLRPMRGMASFGRLLQATTELDYHPNETNFTLGLAELGVRLKRRALVILFTDFVDTVTAELLIESMQRVASRHVVVFVTLRDTLLQKTLDAEPDRFPTVAQAVIAQDLLRERSIVFERLERLGVHCLDVPSSALAVRLINRYLMIKERGLL
jgi:uncharacterized protein (DUF58 family)